MAKESSSARLVITLGIAGLLSGLVLVGIYLVTLPIIKANAAAALEKAVFKVLPGTEEMKPLLYDGDALVPYEGELADAPEGKVVYAGIDADGELIGYAVPAAGNGFQDVIKLIYGFDPKRRVIIGMEVLESRETPGLGDKIYLDAHFLENFEALVVEPEIKACKIGEKVDPNQVDTITGATISSVAVISILNTSMAQWLSVLAPAEALEAKN